MNTSNGQKIDFIEIYTPMAKMLAYWHVNALGFRKVAYLGTESGYPGVASYVLESNDIRIVLTTVYPPLNSEFSSISNFILKNYCGVKRIAVSVASVTESFKSAIENGAIPTYFPRKSSDEFGYLEEAGIKLFDDNEITFINRSNYTGVFKPGYKTLNDLGQQKELLKNIDHVASEVRINESDYWTKYLRDTIGTELVQAITKGSDNKTGMILNINQSVNGKLTFVIAEPDGIDGNSKVQKNVDTYGPGVHHLAFETDDIIETAKVFEKNQVEFVSFPAAYYELLRSNPDFKDINIDELQEMNILCDKEGDSYLFQKFIKPLSDRPFFIYEVVQRINGYNGFALKNINFLKRAEEIEIMNLPGKS